MSEKLTGLDRGAAIAYGGVVKAPEAIILGIPAVKFIAFASVAAAAGCVATAIPALGLGILLADAAIWAGILGFNMLRRGFSKGGGHGH